MFCWREKQYTQDASMVAEARMVYEKMQRKEELPKVPNCEEEESLESLIQG